jgi:hypothetical protein
MSLRLVVLTLVGVLACLRSLAYASPADPTWIGGFWDDDDYDDVVIHIVSFSAADTAVIFALQPRWTPVWIVPLEDEQLVPDPAITARHSRGPPLA